MSIPQIFAIFAIPLGAALYFVAAFRGWGWRALGFPMLIFVWTYGLAFFFWAAWAFSGEVLKLVSVSGSGAVQLLFSITGFYGDFAANYLFVLLWLGVGFYMVVKPRKKPYKKPPGSGNLQDIVEQALSDKKSELERDEMAEEQPPE